MLPIDLFDFMPGHYSLPALAAGAHFTPGVDAPNAIDAIMDAMTASSKAYDQHQRDRESGFGASFLLDISPQAQQYLQGLSLGSSIGVSFTAEQQKKISGILEKYKDAPYTQETFDKIQNDLKAAGLGPEMLALLNRIKLFDPGLVLLDTLNGTSYLDELGLGSFDSQANAYLQLILKQWQTVSTTYKIQDAAA